ncbi:MAG: phenylalanine--tRNA ligase subunit beta [Clostridia bacterium]|nr:phenylalanine--tRNA ligase subunit beta [Clostridia bacterium]
MKLPLKWLKDYVDFNISNKEFATRMLLRGFEVADIIPEVKASGVYVCTIDSISQHPDAERLSVCSVDIGRRDENGEKQPITIVTNAKNIYEGCQVPVALDGAVLADGMLIKPTKMRGVLSEGMFCGGAEIGIGDVEYEGAGGDSVLILEEKHTNGEPIETALGLDDVIFDIELTPNRTDCQSIIGICREAASALGQTLKEPEIKSITGEGDASDYAKVTVENPKLCPRYLARVVTDLKIEPSPKWMQLRLKLAGIRPINNIVDITNFVLLEYGHPMHAFDLACIKDGHIVVRNAKENEIVTTLDGKEREMSPDMLLIADPEKGVGVAGVMGGLNSEITENTKVTLFESAVFLPENIRHTTRKLHHSTDSSARFTKGVEAVNAQKAIDRAIELVEMLGAGKVVGGLIDVCERQPEARTASANIERVNAILNTAFTGEDMCALLASINIPSRVDGGELVIDVPHYRTDIESGLETDADIAEEIGRLYGYDNIAPTLMNGETFHGKLGASFAFDDRIKDQLVAMGFMELYNYNFTSPQEYDQLLIPIGDEKRRTVRIRNPFGEDQSLMRTTLIGGLLRTARTNLNKKSGHTRFFEIGNVHFDNDPDLPEERRRIGLVMFASSDDFYIMKGVVEQLFKFVGAEGLRFERGGGEYLHPGQKALILIDGESVGEMGAVHPKVKRAFDISAPCFIAEIDFNKFFAHIKTDRKFKPLPKFPTVPRDLALVIDENTEAQSVIDVIAATKTDALIEGVRVFDVFYPNVPGEKGIPEGKKSMAVRFELRSDEHTLNDEEINRSVNAILKALKYKLDAVLRS